MWLFQVKRTDRDRHENDKIVYASHVNIGLHCTNKYYIFQFVVLTGHYILYYYYIAHYHICVFIILDKHHFG